MGHWLLPGTQQTDQRSEFAAALMTSLKHSYMTGAYETASGQTEQASKEAKRKHGMQVHARVRVEVD